MKRIVGTAAVFLFAAMLSCPREANAQDCRSFIRIIKELSSAEYQGRGYARDGVLKAGAFIGKEFKKAGVDETVLQPFCIDINTFPGNMEMSVDGRRLTAGTDFVMREYSPGVKGSFPLYYLDTMDYDPVRMFKDLAEPAYSGAFVVCDFWFRYRHREDFARLEASNGIIYVWQTPLKFYKAYGEKVAEMPIVWVDSSFPVNACEVTFDIENRFLKDYRSNNVIARVNGERHDSCYVFTAHYDHLGNLGRDVYFPGANDNASGTAAIITLAAHYSRNRPKFDMYFIAFSGEDANLRGSTHFVSNPTFDLGRIKYLFNLDMIADNNREQYVEVSPEGQAGFDMMRRISDRDGLFGSLNRGELAANSDHWPFAMKGVPCIMFENESGDIFKHYHTPQDTWKTCGTATYESIFRLVTSFMDEDTTK